MGTDFNQNQHVPRLTPELPDSTHIEADVPHATTDTAAVQVVRAEGEFGDKVALAAVSVSNHGVYAGSTQGTGLVAEGATLAAELRGDVQVTKSLAVTQHLVVGGDITVTGDLRLTGADYAEDFTLADPADDEPGTVMVVNEDGAVGSCRSAYDRRVAGVVSGAGGYRPAVILDSQQDVSGRAPLALMGKAFCKVDASYGPVQVGDLLTTSDTAGHAMRATDLVASHGAVLGKALQPLAEGRGLIAFIVTLR